MPDKRSASSDKTKHEHNNHDKRMILDLTDAVEITSFTITTIRHQDEYHQTFVIPEYPFFDLGIPFVLSITSDRREALHELRLNGRKMVDGDLAHATRLDYLAELERSNTVELVVKGNKEATFKVVVYALVAPALFGQNIVKGEGRRTIELSFDNPNIGNRAVLRLINGCYGSEGQKSKHDDRDRQLCIGNGEVRLNDNLIVDHRNLSEDSYIVNASVLLQQHNVITLDLHGHKDANVLVELFPVDAEAPVIAIEGAPPAYTKSHEATIAFTVSEPALTKCSVDGEAATLCSSLFFLENLQEGSHELVITATDLVGRNSEPVRVAWVNDFTPPTLFFVGIEAGQTIVEDTLDIRLGGSEEIIDKSIFLNGEEIGEGWHSLGNYFQQLIGTATDLAGNPAEEIVVPFFFDEDKAKQFFHYAFDNDDLAIQDISLHGRDGDSDNIVFGEGYTGRAVVFDSKEGFVEVSLDNPIVFPGQAFSLSLWIKPIDASGDVFTMSAMSATAATFLPSPLMPVNHGSRLAAFMSMCR